MPQDSVDLTKCVYTITGSNLAFDSIEMAFEYMRRKFGIPADQMKRVAVSSGEFKDGVNICTIRINDKELHVLARRVVTNDNLGAVIDRNW